MDDQAHVKTNNNLTCLQHPSVTEGGEAIEAPIVPGSEMLALMLISFLLHVYWSPDSCDWVMIRFTRERGFADDEYHINIQYQPEQVCGSRPC